MKDEKTCIIYLVELAKYWSDIEYERRFGAQALDSGGQTPPPPPPIPTPPGVGDG